jgi:AraC-like DNA-binding protein
MSNLNSVLLRPLREYVDFFWQSDGYVQPHASERVLPTGTIDVVIDLRAPMRSVASGIQTSSIRLDTSGPLTLFGIRLKAGGAAGVLGIPAVELQNQSVLLNDFWPCADELIDVLGRTSDPHARARSVEKFLFHRIRDSSSADLAIRSAAERWRSAPGSIPVEAMADQLGFGVKRFSRRFGEQVGVAPKSYARIMRFQNAVSILQGMANPDWADVALRAGYYDQAHFNHDFRKFAGCTPSVYLARRTGHPNHMRAVG